jgi:hypothetical protein
MVRVVLIYSDRRSDELLSILIFASGNKAQAVAGELGISSDVTGCLFIAYSTVVCMTKIFRHGPKNAYNVQRAKQR